MTATIDEGRERAWGVASVPVNPPAANPPAAIPQGANPQGAIPPAATPVAAIPLAATPVAAIPLAATPVAAVAPAATRPTRGDRHRRVNTKPKLASKGRTVLVVLVLLAAAGVGGAQIIRQRLADQAFVNLGGVLLTADAVPVGFADAVVVNTVTVTQHAQVTAGQKLATVTSATGASETLTAPVAGTVAAVKVGVGGVARGGEAIVTLYDQARLTFRADVPLPELRRMRLGMTADIEGPGLAHRITTTLDHVVPVVGADQSSTTDKLTVVLVPSAADRETVATLVPGLRFNARVDTNTAPDAVPAVNTG